jgi:hypothetical protein
MIGVNVKLMVRFDIRYLDCNGVLAIQYRDQAPQSPCRMIQGEYSAFLKVPNVMHLDNDQLEAFFFGYYQCADENVALQISIHAEVVNFVTNSLRRLLLYLCDTTTTALTLEHYTHIMIFSRSAS